MTSSKFTLNIQLQQILTISTEHHFNVILNFYVDTLNNVKIMATQTLENCAGLYGGDYGYTEGQLQPFLYQ